MKRFFKALGKFIWNGIKAGIILVLLAALAAGIWLYQKYADPILALRTKAQNIAAASTEADFKSDLTSVVYDANGEKISSLRSGKASYYLTYKELPRVAVDAMLVTEDKKFYAHDGVDYLANVRALYYLVKNKGEITQGGSTITQQLARNIYLTNEVSYERKLVEVFLAWELEKLYSKNDILEFYFNNIYFGNGYYGIQAAAYGYFGRSVKDLSLSETIFICAIPNNPSLYDPLVRMNKTIERRDRMLRQMLEDGKITQAEHDAAVAEEIVLGKTSVTRHNYVETYVYYCAIRALMEQDGFRFRTEFTGEADKAAYEERYDAAYSYWQQKLYTSGYRIYTSIDLDKQALLQEAVNEGTATFTEVNEEGIYKLQASAVCIDNETGYVVAIVGGREQEYVGYTLNRAYQSFRQPGSSIKPLIIYTPWFERGLTPDTMVLDAEFEGGPKNSGSYLGEISVRTAVEQSKNTVAWKLFTELTPETGLNYLKRMKFRRIVATDYVPAVSLGGMTYGVSALEMTSAYAALENDGVFRSPTCIVRITDIDGNEVIGDMATGKKSTTAVSYTEAKRTGSAVIGANAAVKETDPLLSEINRKEIRIYEQNAARMMVDVLKGVMTVGTARKNNLENAIAAGKTGTADDRKDGWFVGFTAYYTTGVWVGCDLPKEIEDLSGSTYPLSIWKNYMDTIHEGLSKMDFEPYTPVKGTYVAPDITLTPAVDSTLGDNTELFPTMTPAEGETIPEAKVTIIPSDNSNMVPTITPGREPAPTPTQIPSDSDGTGNGNSADDFRVTPPPTISWGDGYDPTEDPR